MQEKEEEEAETSGDPRTRHRPRQGKEAELLPVSGNGGFCHVSPSTEALDSLKPSGPFRLVNERLGGTSLGGTGGCIAQMLDKLTAVHRKKQKVQTVLTKKRNLVNIQAV